ncbi:MAG: hypothetical protein AAF446_12090, partial [Pseudomonadota bacterium]
MKYRLLPVLALVTAILAGCGGSSGSDRAVGVPIVTNPDGNPTTAVLTATYDPANAVLPFPINLLFSGSADLTLNIPVGDPTDFSNPAVVANAIDGFSTVTPWTFSFDGEVNPDTVIPGNSVRFFEVQFVFGTVAVQQINRELVPGVDFVTSIVSNDANGATIAIVPLRPLAEATGYMVVVTDSISDPAGNVATPSQTYFITKRTDPLTTGGGVSTDPLLPNATAQALEPLRQLTNAQEIAATSVGIDREDIVLSWTATTQTIRPVLSAIRSTLSATSSQAAPTGLNTGAVVPGSPGIA